MNEPNNKAVFAAIDSTALESAYRPIRTLTPLSIDDETPIFRRYLMMAIRWRVMIIATIMASLLASLFITFLLTPQYTSVIRIDIARENNQIAPVRSVEKESTDADLEFYQTQYGLLRSRSLAEQVAEKLNLIDDPKFFKTFNKRPIGAEGLSWDPEKPLPSAKRDNRKRQVAELLLLHLSVSPVRLSRLVDIGFTCPDPQLSMRVANAWTQNFIAITLERRFDATSYARKFLEGRLEQLRVKLESSEREVVNYASQQGIIDLPIASTTGASPSYRSILAENLAALNTELNVATGDRVKAQARLLQPADGASPEALANTAISALRQRRAELQAERQKLLVQFEADYPTVKALQTQIAQLDRSITGEERRVSNSFQNDYQGSIQRESQLQSKVKALESAMLDLRRRSIQYNIFQRDADTNRQLYDALLQRYKEIGVAGGVGVNNIAVVDPAVAPTLPSSPKLWFNLIIAFGVGVVLGGSVAYLLEQSSETFDNPDDISRLLHMPLLGTVPRQPPQISIVEALADRKSYLTEAYLSVEANLRFTTSHGLPWSISVTSTRPGEGKSTTCYALAILLARVGKRVILIDADMRSPSVHGQFEIQNLTGLSDYLAGGDDIDRLLHRFPEHPRLSVLPAGPQPPNAAELLNGDRLDGLIAKLREQYDHIIIDSPPVMGLADAPLIGSKVEGTILVLESHNTPSSLARVALSRLVAANANILGVLLSKFEVKKLHLGYGYQYGYGYGSDTDKRLTTDA